MNLYLVNRTECDWDEYRGFVVAANTPEEALGYLDKQYDASEDFSDWPNEGEKTAELIGTTDKYSEPTEILGSFNAG
jgi:hypothetical protein